MVPAAESLAKAIFTYSLNADVHPFADRKVRIGRFPTSAQLVRRNLARMVIPTVYREDYLGMLCARSRR